MTEPTFSEGLRRAIHERAEQLRAKWIAEEPVDPRGEALERAIRQADER